MRQPEGTPEHVVVDGDPERRLEAIRAANRGSDVHLVGGPTTIETFRKLGALDVLGLIVVPVLVGNGMRLALEPGTRFSLGAVTPLPSGAVEITYI